MNSMSNVNVLSGNKRRPCKLANGEIINSVLDHYSSVMVAATLLVSVIQLGLIYPTDPLVCLLSLAITRAS